MTELSPLAKMTSREIADLTGKQHGHIMRDIRAMEIAWEKIAGSKFGLGEYRDEGNQLRPEYSLTKRECLYIATKFNDEARAKLVLRWEQLETVKPDFSDPNVVLQLAQSWKDEQEKRITAEHKVVELAEKIEGDASKIVFAETVAGSDNSILVRQFAKDLSDKGFIIGQNRLYTWLRTNKYVNDQNEPYQNYIEQGLFEVIVRTVGAADQTFTVRTTKITGKGQMYFSKKLKQ